MSIYTNIAGYWCCFHARHLADLQAQDGNCWGNFRGDAKLTGVSTAILPGQT